MKLLPNYGRLALLAVWTCCAAVATPVAYGQDTRYVSDRVLVPVRAAGSDFRIVNSGLPSGTALLSLVRARTEMGRNRNTGRHSRLDAIPFLQAEPTASLPMNELKLEVEQLRSERDRVVSQLNQRSSAADEADDTILTLRSELEATTNELTEVKRVSAAALDLDALNQQLVAEVESERSDADLLRLENVRLRERIANNQILDGALAVLLGVILAVVTPRLWPSKKRQDGWS